MAQRYSIDRELPIFDKIDLYIQGNRVSVENRGSGKVCVMVNGIRRDFFGCRMIEVLETADRMLEQYWIE